MGLREQTTVLTGFSSVSANHERFEFLSVIFTLMA